MHALSRGEVAFGARMLAQPVLVRKYVRQTLAWSDQLLDNPSCWLISVRRSTQCPSYSFNRSSRSGAI